MHPVYKPFGRYYGHRILPQKHFTIVYLLITAGGRLL